MWFVGISSHVTVTAVLAKHQSKKKIRDKFWLFAGSVTRIGKLNQLRLDTRPDRGRQQPAAVDNLVHTCKVSAQMCLQLFRNAARWIKHCLHSFPVRMDFVDSEVVQEVGGCFILAQIHQKEHLYGPNRNQEEISFVGLER